VISHYFLVIVLLRSIRFLQQQQQQQFIRQNGRKPERAAAHQGWLLHGLRGTFAVSCGFHRRRFSDKVNFKM